MPRKIYLTPYVCTEPVPALNYLADTIKWVSVTTTASVCKPTTWATLALLYWPTWPASSVCKPTTRRRCAVSSDLKMVARHRPLVWHRPVCIENIMKVVAIIHDASSFSNSNPSGTSGSDIHELLLSLGIASPITPLTGSLSGPSYR